VSVIFAIDPGPVESAYCVIDRSGRPLDFDIAPNYHVGRILRATAVDRYIIEWITSYGMTPGQDVFHTCRWIGRFEQIVLNQHEGRPAELIPRREVKLHHCGNSTAKDKNVTAALVERFAPGMGNFGKGTKDEPGWFHGFKTDVWQAYALAIAALDKGRQYHDGTS